MKLFLGNTHNRAMRHADECGEPALHVFTEKVKGKKPEVKGHLFDRNSSRLTRTAKKLGVKDPIVEYRNGSRQHVFLSGKPLVRAIELSRKK